MHHRVYHWGEFALNVNGPLMILTQKMTQLAFAVKDGERRPPWFSSRRPTHARAFVVLEASSHELALSLASRRPALMTDLIYPICLPLSMVGRSKNFDKMSPNFKKEFARLKCEPPTLLEILGHTFFFANVLCGPNHNYTDYKNFIEGTGRTSTYTSTGTETVDEIAAKVGCTAAELIKGNDDVGKGGATAPKGTELKYVAVARGGVFHGLWCLAGAIFWAAWNMGLPGKRRFPSFFF